jgi:hypothetical protein
MGTHFLYSYDLHNYYMCYTAIKHAMRSHPVRYGHMG